MRHTGEEHGAVNPGELCKLGIDPNEVVDFSTNCNPFGCPPEVLVCLSNLRVTAYPDPNVSVLSQKLAELNHCDPDCILVGNGAAELVWCLVRACSAPDQTLMQLGPTFGEYFAAAKAVGAQMFDYRLQSPDFELDCDHFCQKIQEIQPTLLFVCQPNNPTGRLLKEHALKAIIEATREAGTLLVLDEAYLWFAGQKPFGCHYPRHVINLRSLTKDLGLAGLRLGYLCAQPGITASVKAQQPPWTVNCAAQDCGMAALNSLSWVSDTTECSRRLAEDFFNDLRQLGCEVISTDTHFALVHVGNAAKVRRQLLLKHRIQVRDCQSFGLPEYIRVATQTELVNQKFLKAFASLL